MKRFFISILIVFYLSSCSSSSDKKTVEKSDEEPANNTKATSSEEKQLNISILWDLSDRIDQRINPASPQHYERDIEVIRNITAFFKRDMEKRGAFKAKGRLKVFFSPAPENSQINTIAKNLSCDLSTYVGEGANKKKKEIYDSIEMRFLNNTKEIYRLTIETNKDKKQWDGADIWRFFKNDVKDYCVDPSESYRNILVILTDGYIYHKDSKDKIGNRTAYILPEILKTLRIKPDWPTFFSKENYGLICTRKDLQNLEVLVLEITPSKDHKNDEDIIKTFLSKWFEEMGISNNNYSCYNSDLPEHTKSKVLKFLTRYASK